MSDFSDRLKQARIALGFSVKEAVEAFRSHEVEISEKTLYGWERGIRMPDADVFLRICQVYGIDSVKGFLHGTVKAEPVSELTRKYDSLDEYGQRLVNLVLDEEFNRVHPVVKFEGVRQETVHTEKISPKRKTVLFWVSEQSAAAGTGTYLNEDDFTKRYVPETCLMPGASFGVPVSGDSMEPKYFDGDILMVNKQQMPEIGEIGIFLLDGKGFVKQRGRSELISLNEKYAPIPMDNEVRCFGKVIGVIRADELKDC